MTRPELAPCPFCGVGTESEDGPCANYGIRQHYGEVWFVVCGCPTGVQTADFATVEEAIAAWNRRAPAPESRSQLKRLAAQRGDPPPEFG